MSELFTNGSVESAYDQWARTYDSVKNLTRDLAAKVLRESRIGLSGRHILEIGCGTGVNTSYLADQGSRVTAVDFSTGMLEQCRRNVARSNVIYRQQDLREKWNLDDKSVQAAIMILIGEHIEDLSHIYEEAARVLTLGGEFFICELHPYRQIQGKQARYVDVETGEEKLIPAYLHQISEYVNLGIEHRFELLHLGEWQHAVDVAVDKIPRLATFHFALRGKKKKD